MGTKFFFEDYAALFVFFFDIFFFWHFVTKFVELSTIKNLDMEDLRGLALNKIAQFDLF